MNLRISLGQMDVALGEPERNLATVRAMTVEAARRGSDIVLFPELWSTGYDLERAADYATTIDNGLFARVAALARDQHIHILGSTLSLLGEGLFGNTAVLFDASGQSLGHYSKMHLFRLMEEDQYLTAGDDFCLAETEWGQFGLTICYDLRFPEMFRAYALAGAVLAFVPSEWPHPRLHHWRTLLRARAIENQMFIVACNRVGRSKESEFFGHSTIVDPWGETVVEGGEGEMLLTADIDLDQAAAARARIPVFADRRPELYDRIDSGRLRPDIYS